MKTKTENRGWKSTGDYAFERMFGPIKCTVNRQWGIAPNPTHFHCWLSVGDVEFDIPISALGVDWFDDECERKACGAAEKHVKELLRSWVK